MGKNVKVVAFYTAQYPLSRLVGAPDNLAEINVRHGRRWGRASPSFGFGGWGGAGISTPDALRTSLEDMPRLVWNGRQNTLEPILVPRVASQRFHYGNNGIFSEL